MKKYLVRLALPALIAVVGLAPTASAWAAPIDPVAIPDAGLRGCITEALGLPADATPTQGQLATLSYLRCLNRHIGDLTGVEYLTNVQGFDLTGNDVVDLTPIGSMSRLLYLTLNDNHITDLRPIGWLAGLFGNVCGECGGGPRAYRQTVTLPDTPVSQAVPFTVTDIFGAPAPLTVPAGVGYADGNLTFSEPGTYSITWSAVIAPDYDVVYFSGSATITVTPDDVPPAIVPGDVSVTGTAMVGQTLSARPGAWEPASVQLNYQWLRDGHPIRSATADRYLLTTQDVGHRLAVQVTGSAPGYDDVVVLSEPTDVVVKKARR